MQQIAIILIEVIITPLEETTTLQEVIVTLQEEDIIPQEEVVTLLDETITTQTEIFPQGPIIMDTAQLGIRVA